MSIYVYKDLKGQCPFLQWLDQIKVSDKTVFNKINYYLDLMSTNQLPLVKPNVKKTPTRRTNCSCLYKLRIGKYRLFFLFKNNNYYLFHCFRKTTQKTPNKEFTKVKREINTNIYIKYL
ncbi:MAG: type II toxin-antitoxin system RelE/ParE family toxin [Firmicutes bacterium]|uniref:Type II toxin-antitoxin system RelE/ParE family toxin n=1 Tax=Candidatus Gallilactobacillus intestinavium TaxID=2840838 RepID=A0A9D9E613_9LACO|nr:type II toxin-antitoxin system RelE/ParE family toxin [Candidatus Gallilactobacillus intestinavium]